MNTLPLLPFLPTRSPPHSLFLFPSPLPFSPLSLYPFSFPSLSFLTSHFFSPSLLVPILTLPPPPPPPPPPLLYNPTSPSPLALYSSLSLSLSTPPSLPCSQPHLLAPPEKAIGDMITVFNRMMKTSCAISKLEYLLEVVRLTYENIRDSRQPKKPMNDLGADGKLNT